MKRAESGSKLAVLDPCLEPTPAISPPLLLLCPVHGDVTGSSCRGGLQDLATLGPGPEGSCTMLEAQTEREEERA